MKLIKIVPIIVILLIGVVYSCDSDTEFTEEAKADSINNIDQRGMATKSTSLNPVNLLTAGDFAILSKTGVTNVPTTVITGDVGASPITGAAILIHCNQVAGRIYTTDGAGIVCGWSLQDGPRLSSAVSAMEAAYTDAAGRINPISFNLGGGSLSGNPFWMNDGAVPPGVHKWTTDLDIYVDLTLRGSSTDVWIFQVEGKLNMAAAKKIILEGAQAKNIFWVVADEVILGTTSHFEGNILCAKAISLLTGASLNGRALGQTAVILQQCTITKPLD